MKQLLTLFLMLSLSLNFCSKNTNNNNGINNVSAQDQNTGESLQTRLDNFKPSITPHSISKLDLPTSLQIYISFLEDQIVWQKENGKNGNINSESEEDLNKDSQEYLQKQAQQKEQFFKKWGISYSDFDQYFLTHSQEIQDYLKTHTEEQTKIGQLEEFLSSIQNSSPVQNDDYNFKDENALIEQTTEKEEGISSDENGDTKTPKNSSDKDIDKVDTSSDSYDGVE